MVELAIATGIPPALWAAEPAEVIATAVDVLNERAQRKQ